jgi:hypothetical protein
MGSQYRSGAIPSASEWGTVYLCRSLFLEGLVSFMILIRRNGQSVWHTPTTTAYSDEKALQELIAQSPSLLPGANDVPMAVVRELAVPSIGYVDLVGVDQAGTITIVECKLKANPEIRRQVVGQV